MPVIRSKKKVIKSCTLLRNTCTSLGKCLVKPNKPVCIVVQEMLNRDKNVPN